MLLLAQQRAAQLPSSVSSKLSFSFGDVRGIRLNRQFDAVISLFHVYSYQTTNALSQVGLQLVKSGEWMTPKPAGVYAVAQVAASIKIGMVIIADALLFVRMSGGIL